jgi:hypothetical protein
VLAFLEQTPLATLLRWSRQIPLLLRVEWEPIPPTHRTISYAALVCPPACSHFCSSDEKTRILRPTRTTLRNPAR